MTADSYQRDYEAMMEWVSPHRHEWRYNPRTDAYICNKCGVHAPPSELKRGEYREKIWMHRQKSWM